MGGRGPARSNYHRWAIALVVALTAVTSLGAVAGAAEQVDPRPNIILISADDMRADDIWVMDNLRNLLTEQGTTFANSCSPFPLCCPARASIVTGQYAHNHGVLDNNAPLGGYQAVDSSSTLATWLQDAGYLTSLVGKYLNRYGEKPVSVPRAGRIGMPMLAVATTSTSGSSRTAWRTSTPVLTRPTSTLTSPPRR